MSNNNQRRKGFSFLSFFLGFLFAILVIAGALFGVGYFVLCTDLDKVMNTAGVENKDGEGNYIYVNTDTDNGGVKNVWELVKKVQALAGNTQEMSIGQIENLLPVAGGLVDGIYDALNAYVKIDRDELVNTKFSDFGGYIQNTVLDLQPATLLDSFGMGGVLDNKIVEILICGAEASYVVDGDANYPVYYDTYILADGAFVRETDDSPLPAGMETYLSEYKDAYRLNFYGFSDGNKYVTYENEGKFVVTSSNEFIYSQYSAESAVLSGNYYFEGADKIVENPITLRTFADGGLGALDGVFLTDMLGENPDETVVKILEGITLGDIINGNLDFDEVINAIELGDFVSVTPDDKIMTLLVYNIKDIKAVSGEDYAFTGTYTEGNVNYECFIEVDGNGNLSGAYYMAGEREIEITSITVGQLTDGFDLNSLMDGLGLPDFIDVKIGDAVLLYLGYGVYNADVKTLTGKIDVGGITYDCSIAVEDGTVKSVSYFNGTETVDAGSTSLNEVPARIEKLTQKLKIKDIIEIPAGNKIMEKLGEYTIANVPDAISELEVSDVMDIPVDNFIMLYMAYGITDIDVSAGTCLIGENTYYAEISDGNVISVYSDAEHTLKAAGTAIDGIPDRISNITSDLKLGQLMDIPESSTVLYALKDYTVNELPSAIKTLKIGQLIEINEQNLILEAIKDSTIQDIPTTISNLTINELYAAKIYGGRERTVIEESKFDPAYIYYKLVDGKYELAGTRGKVDEYEKGLYTFGQAEGEWKLLLYTGNSETAYSMNNLDQMIANVSSNLKDFKMRELHAAGILVFNEDKDLEKRIPIGFENGQTKYSEPIGDMSLTTFIFYVVNHAAQDVDKTAN